jgi:hypothetical protein
MTNLSQYHQVAAPIAVAAVKDAEDVVCAQL